MGNKESTTQKQPFIEHQKLGAIRVFEETIKNEDGQNQQIPKMQVTRQILQKSHYEQWVQQYKKINDAEGQQLFLVPQKHEFEKAGFCGSSGVAKITYNKFEFVLSSQIKNRNNLSKYFDETQIWYVLYNLIRAGNKFQLWNEKIGDIHPNNILINEDGQTAIISRLSLPGQVDNFQKYLEDKKAEVFLAPEEMKIQDIEKGVYNQKVDKCLAEVFSIGLTVLSAGTLEHCNDVYERQPFRIKTERLTVLLNQFAKRYSPYLTETLRSMLELSPEKRVRSKQLYGILSQYDAQILDLEPFYPGNHIQHSPQGLGYVQQAPPNVYYNPPYQHQPLGYQPQVIHGQQYGVPANNPLPHYNGRFNENNVQQRKF